MFLLATEFLTLCFFENIASAFELSVEVFSQGERDWVTVRFPEAPTCTKYYKSMPHQFAQGNYFQFIDEDPCQEIVKDVADQLWEYTELKGLGEREKLLFLLNWVKRLGEFETDTATHRESEYVTYPFQTLLAGIGDCEDSALLMASILNAWCFNAILFPLIFMAEDGIHATSGHLALGIKMEPSWMKENENSFILPTRKGHSREIEWYVYADPTFWRATHKGAQAQLGAIYPLQGLTRLPSIEDIPPRLIQVSEKECRR
jgi:hypothetical protein